MVLVRYQPWELLFQGVTAMGIRRHVTSTQLYLLPAKGHMEVCVTIAGTTPRARTVSGVSCTISGTGDQALLFRRPVSVSMGSRDPIIHPLLPTFSGYNRTHVPGDTKATGQYKDLVVDQDLWWFF